MTIQNRRTGNIWPRGHRIPVTKLGGTEKQIDISESYNGNNSNEFRGFANKIRI